MQDIVQWAVRARAAGGQFWQGLTRTQRAAVVAVGVVGAGLLMFFVFWAGAPSYAVAFSSLSDEQAGAVVAKLKELKVPYQVRDGGTVLVPSEQVHDIRLQLATAGLPQGSGAGFELFDQTSFGLTDFAQKINYQRALEGELSRTINRLEAVEQSRVHIVIPQPTLYTDAQKEATASVVLHLRPGRELSRSQLRGITQLVAGSVEGLKPENLTIVDGNGQVLSDVATADGLDPSAASAKVEAQSAYEARLADSLQSMLNRTIGPNRTTVHVSAELDWDKVETNSEIYSPDGTTGQVRSQHEVTEAYGDRAAGTASGIPGVDSNVPTYQALPGEADAASSDAGAQRRESTTNYELSRRTEHVVKAPGGLKRLSVAVVADSATVPPEQVESLREVVSAAAGLDPKRGDVVTVTALPFDKTDYQAAIESAQQQDMILSLAKTAGTVLGPLLLLGFLWLILRPRRRAPAGELAPAATPLLAAAGGRTLPTVDTQVLLPPTEEETRREQVRKQIYALAKDNPSLLAQLIETWLDEDR